MCAVGMREIQVKDFEFSRGHLGHPPTQLYDLSIYLCSSGLEKRNYLSRGMKQFIR